MQPFRADLVAEPHAISALTENVAGYLQHAGVDERCTHHVCLVLDEVLSNLAGYSGLAAPQASVEIGVAADRVDGRIVDNAPPFDPRGAAEPVTSGDIAERAIGGLGLMLVRKLTASLDYGSAEGRNRLSFAVARSAAPAEK